MKRIFTLALILSFALALPAQTITITDTGCGIETFVLQLVGDDGMGRNVYEEDFGQLRVRFAYNHNTSRWEISLIDQGQTFVISHTTFDSKPNPPDFATAASNDEPYTDGPDIDCGITSVSGDGTQDNLGGDPCADFNGDSDGDGVCDDFDVCPGFDDLADQDEDGLPDGCDPNPMEADGVSLLASCLSDEPIIFLFNDVDSSGRNRYSNFVFQLHLEYDAQDGRWEVVAHDPGTEVFFYNEFPSFPDPPDSDTSPWTDTEATCSGSDGTVSGTGTQDFLGCDILVEESFVLYATCPEGMDGAIEVTVDGSAGDAAFSINGTAADTSIFPDLSPGSYEIIATDSAFPSNGPYVCADTITLDVFGEDITPPLAACLETVVVELDSMGTGALTAEDINLGSMDECGPVSLSLDREVFSCEDLGESTATLTVIDEAGLESRCTTLVTITDPSEFCTSTSTEDLFARDYKPVRLPLFPNPARNGVNIDISELDFHGKNVTLIVYNTLGQDLLKRSISPNSSQQFYLDTSAYPSGNYHVQIRLDGHIAAGATLLVER